MRVLLTGITSFTGFWFARALISSGHSVIAAVRGHKESYDGLRARRLASVAGGCELRWGLTFGAEDFLAMLRKDGPFDLFCHHAADATNYKSQDFDALVAAQANSRSLARTLAALGEAGCGRVVLTGSVFEAREGAGSTPLRAFNPYGVSKTLTSEMFEYYVQRQGMALGKFVIPNPFGPFEEPRFTDYLLRCWHEGKTARVNTPDYVRDNIHVSLLALAYADFVASLPPSGFHKFNPSFYVESQGAFATRFAGEIGGRLGLDTPLELAAQTDFSEPMTRINTDRVAISPDRWREADAWDAAADYYREKFALAERV